MGEKGRIEVPRTYRKLDIRGDWPGGETCQSARCEEQSPKRWVRGILAEAMSLFGGDLSYG